MDSWPRYRFYGLTVASDFEFANRMPYGAGAPDLTFTCVDASPRSEGWRDGPVLYEHPHLIKESGEPFLTVHKTDDGFVMHYTCVADFHLWDDRIVCHVLDRDYDYLVEIRLLGQVISLWLELRGVLALHASAVVVDDVAVAFASTNGGGKTSAAAILTQSGYDILTDDLLAVSELDGVLVGAAGHPQMRMWPKEAQLFAGQVDDLEIVHRNYTKRRVPLGGGGFGSFTERKTPLGVLYVLERDPSAEGISINAVRPADAVPHLLRHTFAYELVDALRLQARRLPMLAALIAQVPIRHVVHTTPRERLPELRDLILADVGEARVMADNGAVAYPSARAQR